MERYTAVLQGGAPWGFRLQGGYDTGEPLTISKVNPNSKATKAHIDRGDVVETINGTPAFHLNNKDAINLVHGSDGDLELVLCRQTGLMNGSTDNNNMSTSSTTTTTVIRPDPSASDNETIELDGVTLQGFSPSNVSVVKTTTTKVTKITRSRSPSPSPMNQPANVTTGTISFVGGGDPSEPVRQSGDGMPATHTGSVCFKPAGSQDGPFNRNSKKRRSSRGALMFHARQMAHGVKKSDSVDTEDEIEEPPPPRILEAGQMLPPVSHQPKPTYSTNNNDESWPAPPPPVARTTPQRQEAPIMHHPAMPVEAVETQQSQPHLRAPPSRGHTGHAIDKPKFRPVVAPKGARPGVWSPSQPSQSSQNVGPGQDAGSLKDVPPVWSPTGTAGSRPVQGYKPVKLDLNRQPRPTVEGASDSGRSNDDSLRSPSYQFNPPSASRPSPGSTRQPQHAPEVYRPTQASEQFTRPPPPASEQYRSTNAPQQYAGRPATESNSQYPQPPDVPAEYKSIGRPRTSSDPGGREGEQMGQDFKPVPNGHAVNLPRSVSPTVTLLQYQRDEDLRDQIREQLRHPNSEVKLDPSDLPEGALYQTQTVEGDVVHTDTYYPMQKVKTTKKERRVVEAPTYEGIGPRDQSTGLPLGLRQHVKETNRHDWYKEMFKSIHKRDEEEEQGENDDVFVPVNHQQESQSSAPPPPHNNNNNEDDYKAGQPGSVDGQKKGEVDARWDPQRYQAQPRSIEKYAPGSSSLAAKDRTPNADMYNPPPEPIEAAQFGKRTIEPLKREIRRQVNAAPSRTADDSQLPRPAKEPPIGQSKPQAATLPRLPKPRSSESSGLSAVERLGIKSPPPKRNLPSTPNASTKERDRMLSGGDRLYNYRNPPSTVDKATAEVKDKDSLSHLQKYERLIEEERQKRKLRDSDNQNLRRHSDFQPVKTPIITNERFNDLLGEPPKVAEKPVPKWKQEVKACALALYPFKAQTAKELSFAKGDTIYLRRDIDKNWFEGEHHGSVGIFPKAYVEVVTSIDEARVAMLSAPSTEGKARAKYRFRGETQLEMSFSKGDIIDLVRKIDDNWWEAKLGTKKGIVPASYVDVIREPSGVMSPPSKSPIHTRSPIHSPPINNSTPTHSRIGGGGNISQDSYQYPSSMGSPSISASNKPRSMWDKDSYSISSVPDSRITPTKQQTTQSSSQSTPVHIVDPRGLMQQLQDKYRAIYPYMPMNDDELELEEGDVVLVMERCDDGWFVGTSTRTHMFGTFPGNYVEKM